MSKPTSIRHKSTIELVELARAQDTDADTLEILIESNSEAVVLAVAEHPNTKPETLAALVPTGLQSPFYLDLAIRLAQNARTPDYALRRLGLIAEACISRNPEQEGCQHFAVSICCNPNTPMETIASLLLEGQRNTKFRVAVATNCLQSEILQKLASDRNKEVRAAAIRTLTQL